MQRRRLHPLLLAALAAVLLAAGLAPASPSEAADEASEAEMITTVLHPGWNAVGWVGPTTPVWHLFEEIGALRVVATQDETTRDYRYAWPGRQDEFPMLTPGLGLWLYVSGDTPVRWTRPAAPAGLVLRLRPGLNLVGVVSDGAVDLSAAAASDAWRWDPSRQEYEPYRFGDATLTGGEALWIEASEPVNWWQPGKAEPPFVFLGDVPTYRRQQLLTEYANVRRFFAEHFAVATRGRLHYIAADAEAARDVYAEVFGDEPREGFCGRSSQEIDITVLRCIGPPEGTLDYDYVGQLLLEIPGKGVSWRGEPTLDPRGPGWLITGAQQYALASYREATTGPDVRQRRNLQTGATRISLPLSHFEVSENRDGDTNFSERALGFFAVEWLAQRTGNASVFDYLRLMRTSTDWRAAFATAFGIDVEDFYRAFAAYRAADLSPLPHLIDDLEEPVLLFVGGVPEAHAAAIRTEFENVQRFYAERFEARATEFTLYVTPDRESAVRAFPERRYYSCGSPPSSGTAVAPLDQCGASLPLEQIYVGAMVGELAPLPLLRFTDVHIYTERSRGPNWLIAGLEEYARAAYRAAAGGTDLAADWERYARRARTTSYSLRDAATSTGGSVLALGYLAVDWLVERAGEPAVFDYYRVLPSSTSAEAAFESAFGLTLEDFYEQFEAYHATLRQ